MQRQVGVARDVQSVFGGSTSTQVGASGQLHIGDDATTTVGGHAVASAQDLRFDAADSVSAVAGHDFTASAKDQMTLSTTGASLSLHCYVFCAPVP